MVSVGLMAPFDAVLLHAVEPQAPPQTHQFTSVNGNGMARRSGSCRSMASSMASGGVQPNSSSHGRNVPKSEPFNQSRISRLLREPSLLEKAEHALAERCTHLEGDEAYRCWEALFEFEDIKEVYQTECDAATVDERLGACRRLERFQNLVRQSGGVSGLIDNIRMVARTAKKQQEQEQEQQQQKQEPSEEVPEIARRPVFLEDGGLPQDPDVEELLNELPESNITRMLRHSGRYPAWFTQRPDHESD